MNDELIERARAFAVAAHGDQRYGSAPYSVHLAAVHDVAVAFGLDRSIRAAAWLHDCLEDTPTPYGALVENFGREVAELKDPDAQAPRAGGDRIVGGRDEGST